jgi:hypothetical protein
MRDATQHWEHTLVLTPSLSRGAAPSYAAASLTCWPSLTRHVALVSSGHGASSLQHNQPCALPTSSDWPTYQYGLAYQIERDGTSTQSLRAPPHAEIEPLSDHAHAHAHAQACASTACAWAQHTAGASRVVCRVRRAH